MNRFLHNAARLVRDVWHLPKTIWFNFHYFPFRTAIRLPVLVSAHVRLHTLKGRLILQVPVRHRMIRIGFGNVGIFDRRGSKSIWEVSGTVVFEGRADIGHGSKICVHGLLTLGDNFTITAESQLVCFDTMTFGRDCLLSWQVLVMDTDFHAIHAHNGDHLNPNRPICIGDKNWIGCRVLILKGVTTPANCVIAAGSTVSRSIATGNAILAGSPAVVIRPNISWTK